MDACPKEQTTRAACSEIAGFNEALKIPFFAAEDIYGPSRQTNAEMTVFGLLIHNGCSGAVRLRYNTSGWGMVAAERVSPCSLYPITVSMHLMKNSVRGSLIPNT